MAAGSQQMNFKEAKICQKWFQIKWVDNNVISKSIYEQMCKIRWCKCTLQVSCGCPLWVKVGRGSWPPAWAPQWCLYNEVCFGYSTSRAPPKGLCFPAHLLPPVPSHVHLSEGLLLKLFVVSMLQQFWLFTLQVAHVYPVIIDDRQMILHYQMVLRDLQSITLVSDSPGD